MAKVAEARQAARTAKAMQTLGIGIDSALGVTRAGQGSLALYNGQGDEAAGYLGEATLRLLGVSSSVISSLKARDAIRGAGSSEAYKQKHWSEYWASDVGPRGDVASLIAKIQKRGITIKEGSEAAYDRATSTITYTATTPRWGILEEYLHTMVHKQGWFAEEIQAARNALPNRTMLPSGKYVKIGSKGLSAEEIVVKQYLLDHLPLNEATKKLLGKQIDQLKTFGQTYGY